MDNQKLELFYLVRFSKKAGKIDQVLEAGSSAMLKLQALKATPSTKASIIFSRETGKVVFIAEGTEDGFPKVRDSKDKPLGHIDEYSKGLLEAVRTYPGRSEVSHS